MEENSTYRNKQSQAQKFRETIEMKYLRKHSIFVNSIVGLLIFPTLFLLHSYEASVSTLFVYGLFFFILFFINLAFFAYEDYFNSLKLSMYITALGIYVMTTSLIIELQTPSIYTSIFLAYAIISLYQDAKVTVINNLSLFFIGILAISQYQNIFDLQDTQVISKIYVYIFLTIFVLLISITSSVFIKRKYKFYDKLAEVQETEIRTLQVLFDLKNIYRGKYFEFSEYYKYLEGFTEAITKEHNLDNVFKDKIKTLKQIHTKTYYEINKIQGEIEKKELLELKRLELGVHNKITYLAYKIGLLEDFEITKEEIFSETRFKSLKHYDDDLYTKIIAFSVFYVLLRIEKPFLRGLTNQEIKEYILESEYFHLIDSKIRDIYLKNSEVFDKIYKDSFQKG